MKALAWGVVDTDRKGQGRGGRGVGGGNARKRGETIWDHPVHLNK